MVCVSYQGNDEIPTHINCRVSVQDAERESALAKRLGKAISAQTPRKRKMVIYSGLTVEKTNSSSSKLKDTRAEIENDAALQDVFLPNGNVPTQASMADGLEDTLQELDTSGAVHARGREVFGFESNRKSTGFKSIIEKQWQQHPSNQQQQKGGHSQTDTYTAASSAENEVKRRRFTRTVSRMNEAGSGEDEDEEGEHGSEEDSDSDIDQKERRDNVFETTVHDANEPQKSFFEEDEMGAERYFQDLYQKSKTSNNTLSKLPTLEHADFIQAIKRAPAKHAKEMEMLMLLYEEQFPQWYFELMSGFNLLIYGYGSKRSLLTKFATSILTDAPLIIVNGYFPTLTIKEILDKINTAALQYSGPVGTLQEQIALIHAYFTQPDRSVKKLYLLIHNIDGSSLRSEKIQSALSLLASCPQIHLIASMDHINANILWDTVKSARFRWVWHELTTFRPYMTETSFENSIMVRQGELGPRGIQFVLASLTSNGKGLFRILAEHQIQTERESAAGGVSGAASKNYMDWGMAYNTLFKKCQENFLVSNAVTFRTQLTEFRDHRIVQSKKGADGVEILFIPLSGNILEGILDKMG
ncbi:Origin recognition complex subunit 2 [Entomortierella chlamydospora]|uniref:Origin recognition complex subunit 2 n=1 Tax=Entomortierella chlamydospora TaxID=101097 RepID=A0A9P6T3K7_9FUNG|nr:Origin recognition complex subunit 2 [Entomortierella chlamydospora]KAG0022371.1 Origin recognition complex subunit 2 [Entomortierella chlamydospora]